MTTKKNADGEVGTTPVGVLRARARLGGYSLQAFVEGKIETHAVPPIGTVTIGRGPAATVRIEHPSISRKHAALHLGERLLVEDLGSQNGTKVRSTSLPPSVAVEFALGDAIELGLVTLVLRAAEGAAAAAPGPSRPAALREEMQAFERQRIVDALSQCGGNQTRAAKLLGLSRRGLLARMTTYDLPRPRK